MEKIITTQIGQTTDNIVSKEASSLLAELWTASCNEPMRTHGVGSASPSKISWNRCYCIFCNETWLVRISTGQIYTYFNFNDASGLVWWLLLSSTFIALIAAFMQSKTGEAVTAEHGNTLSPSCRNRWMPSYGTLLHDQALHSRYHSLAVPTQHLGPPRQIKTWMAGMDVMPRTTQ